MGAAAGPGFFTISSSFKSLNPPDVVEVNQWIVWSPVADRIVYTGPKHTIGKINADGAGKEALTARPEVPVG